MNCVLWISRDEGAPFSLIWRNRPRRLMRDGRVAFVSSGPEPINFLRLEGPGGIAPGEVRRVELREQSDGE